MPSEGGRKAGQRRRGLDTVATLPRQPEETGNDFVKAYDRRAVGNKTAEPSPFAVHPDVEICSRTYAVDRYGDIEFFRLCIARRRWRLVRR